MKHITFYFDPISPYAYLAFEQLPQALIGHSYRVSYKPVLFGALLKHFGQLGPAEMPGKRDWTYRQVLWLAHRHGVELALPAATHSIHWRCCAWRWPVIRRACPTVTCARPCCDMSGTAAPTQPIHSAWPL